MGFTCGIIGLPNVGKSTVFNALSDNTVPASNYPFCTVEPNRGTAPVRDECLAFLGERLKPEKLTPTILEFLDVAGLVKGASQGEGLGNAFLGHIRAVDIIVHVVRFFEDNKIVHIPGAVGPLRDIQLIETELILADLEVIERRKEKIKRTARTGQKDALKELRHLESIQKALNEGIPLRKYLKMAELPSNIYKEWGLLTDRPIIYVLNLDEEQIVHQDEITRKIKEKLKDEDSLFVPLSAKLEMEIRDLDSEERDRFREEMQLGPCGLDRLVLEGYRLLNLITFYTIAGKEVRAWTIRKGNNACHAAGKIHSDMQQGFIKAEVIHFNDFSQAGSEEKAKQQGLVHIEGKEYLVADRDILRIQFQR